MTTAVAWIVGVASTVASGISTTATVYLFKLIIRIEVLEELFTEKKATLDAVKNSQDDLDRRVTRVEDAVVALKEIVPELKKLSTVAQRLEVLFEVKDGRIDHLEDKVFGK